MIALNAAETLREFILPFIGIVARKSHDFLTNFLIPSPSLPITIPIFPL